MKISVSNARERAVDILVELCQECGIRCLYHQDAIRSQCTPGPGEQRSSVIDVVDEIAHQDKVKA